MTVFENVAYPLRVRRLSQEEVRRRVSRALELARLPESLGARKPGTLSGGEQQRVALARAFAPEPDLLLADEPTGNLDHATGEQVMDLLFHLRAKAGTTLLLITHDRALAARCDRLVHLADGRIAAPASA